MNKWCLITGCNSLLGIAMAKEALDLDYNILAFYNNRKERLLQLQNDFTDRVEIIQATFNEQGLPGIKDKLDAFGQPITALINNAGTLVGELSMQKLDPKIIIQAYVINSMAPLLLCSYVFEQMKEQKQGKIINISSTSAKYGGSGANIHYGMSKAALDVLTSFFAREGAPYNILVNSIRPGLIDTEFHENNRPGRDLSPRIKINPLGRMAKVKEISRLARYLLSESGNYMTGEILTVAGGD